MRSLEIIKLRTEVIVLRKAIKKWSLISVGLGEDKGGNNCALCNHYGANCRKCPVAEFSSVSGCLGTPWIEWAKHYDMEHHPFEHGDVKVKCGHCRTLANEELMYLQKLLERSKEKLKTIEEEEE